MSNHSVTVGQQWSVVPGICMDRLVVTIVRIDGEYAICRRASGKEQPFRVKTLSRGLRGCRLVAHADGRPAELSPDAMRRTGTRRSNAEAREAPARRKVKGPRAPLDEQAIKFAKLAREGVSTAMIAARFAVSRSHVGRKIREAKDEGR